MKIETNSEEFFDFADRVTGAFSRAFVELHRVLGDVWDHTKPARPQMMHCLAVKELSDEFLEDGKINHYLLNQLHVFGSEDHWFRVKKTSPNLQSVTGNNTVRDRQWGIGSYENLSLEFNPVLAFVEPLVLGYDVDYAWSSLRTLGILELRNSIVVDAIILPLDAEPQTLSPSDSEAPIPLTPRVFKVRRSAIERRRNLRLEEDEDIGDAIAF